MKYLEIGIQYLEIGAEPKCTENLHSCDSSPVWSGLVVESLASLVKISFDAE
jgi:hypothetical protein